MICALAERDVSDVTLDDLLCHVGGAVEHDVLARPAVELLDLLQELDRFAGIIYSLYDFHLKGFISRI